MQSVQKHRNDRAALLVTAARRCSVATALFIGTVAGGQVLLGQAEAQDVQSPTDVGIFDGTPVAPMKMFVGDTDRWDVPVGPTATSSYTGAVSVDLDTDPRGLVATWNGKGDGQLYMASGEPQDLSRIAASDAALIIVMKVSRSPKRKVTLRMGCGYPCGADADITKLLKAAPRDEWIRVSFDLQCFTKEGLRPDNVDTPFLLLTRGRLAVSIADVRIVANARDKATVKCS